MTPPPAVETIGAAAARRAALAAQGFADPRPAGPVTRRHLARTLDRIRLLQLDSVNVAVRAHYMPLYSRLGPYQRELVDDAAWSHSARRPRLLAEYWAHEASLLPVEDWPLLRAGAKRDGWWRHYGALVERHPGLVDDVLAAVKELGPIGAGALETAVGGPSRPRPPGASWWERSDVKRICEYLFGIGALTTGTRRHFQRLYDLPERVLPPHVLAAPAPSQEEAARALVLRSAAALGVATETDLRDYYRLAPAANRAALLALVEAGELEPVEVRGWARPGYRVPGARLPRRIGGRALLSPFDPLIWERSRTERIFGFRYRIEIYVPEPKREYGYYVFPFLLDGELVARVDIKADRRAGVLRVPGAFAEPGADLPRVTAELAGALREMADWLELDGVVAGERGDLAAPLASAVHASHSLT
ncbi:winged helix-turn-helix domain-containing protein [Pseudonocardia alaniniphila]|uniref:Winged helix DNA-binding domain-containing protein n=1 Tax=Pseudonocardia alaniniphila TaxID=75291 RepID=A0ABS9TLN8_9PSEU|nr:crosslink repair DNA glycosylase YcaQ family protein [Pseudonocardia alaniniphila]MCH6169457.1 winged helix DNA-binding domain-containing protein [Pseudonocardia alaniniphila]